MSGTSRDRGSDTAQGLARSPAVRETLETAMDGLALLDDEGRFEFVNQAHATIYGYADPTGLVGRHWSVLYDEDELERIEQEALSALEEQGYWRGRAIGIRQDGSRFPQEVSLRALDEGLVCSVRDLSEEERHRRLLDQYRENLELAGNVAGVGHWSLDPGTGQMTWSEGLYDLLNRSTDALESPTLEAFLDHVSPADRERVRSAIQDAPPEGARFRLDHRLEPVDRDAVHVRTIGNAPGPSPSDLALGTVVVLDRPPDARSASENVELYEMVLDRADLAVWEVRGEPGDQEFVYAGPAMEAVFGLTPDEAAQDWSRWAENVHEDDREQLREARRRATEEGEDQTVRYRFHRPGEDEPVWIETHLVPRRMGDEVVGITGISEEVTEHVDRVRELERQRGDLELAERAANLGHWSWDVQTGRVDWSKSEYELFGRDPETFEPSYEAFIECVHPEDRDGVADRLEEALEERSSFTMENRIVRPDGEVRVIHTNGHVETDGEGRPVRLFGTSQDVTDRAEREERLEAFTEELVDANERLERFAFVAAHDLKEPLRDVATHLQLVRKRLPELDDRTQEALQTAVDGCKRAHALMDDLREYTLAETEGARLEPVGLDEILEETLDNLEEQIEFRGAEISVGDLHEVLADPAQISQVLRHLVANGMKFNESETPRIHVESERVGSRVVVSVQDDGIGIADAYQDRIFGIFQRLHGRQEYAGNGLGLAVSKRIVDRHDGEIWVRSEPGEGSTFCFTLTPADGAERTNGAPADGG